MVNSGPRETEATSGIRSDLDDRRGGHYLIGMVHQMAQNTPGTVRQRIKMVVSPDALKIPVHPTPRMNPLTTVGCFFLHHGKPPTIATVSSNHSDTSTQYNDVKVPKVTMSSKKLPRDNRRAKYNTCEGEGAVRARTGVDRGPRAPANAVAWATRSQRERASRPKGGF